VSLKEYCFSLWDQHKPKTFREARRHLYTILNNDPTVKWEFFESTLMVYFTHWRKARGLSKPRPHRKRERKADE
jgi:hypothetical protein